MKKITNYFILDPSNEVINLIDELKKRGITEENFVKENNYLRLYVAGTPLFSTLTETANFSETIETYCLYYQNKLLATTEKKINSTGETYSTNVNAVYLPDTLSITPVSPMESEDYRKLQDDFRHACWEDKKQEIIRLNLERSLMLPENLATFNEYAKTVFQECYKALNSKTKQTSYSGFGHQFWDGEQEFIKNSAFLMEYMSWLTPENQNLAQTVGLEFLRTIRDGYDFLPNQPCLNFFTKPEDIKTCVDNFIGYARLSVESCDESGEWSKNEQRRFNSFIDFAIENDLNRLMDDEQRKHFFETIYLIGNAAFKLPQKTLMLFSPVNIKDRTIFNEIFEDNLHGKKIIPIYWGLIRKSILDNATKAELDHLKKLLPHDKLELLHDWGYIDKPEIDQNSSPDFLLPEKIVTRIDLRSYLPTRNDINWEKWLKEAFAPYADVKLFIKEFDWRYRIEFTVALKHKHILRLSSEDTNNRVYFNMDGSGLLLGYPHIHFSVRWAKRNGSGERYYLSEESSVLVITVENFQVLEKDFDKKWQEITAEMRSAVAKLFDGYGIYCNRGKGKCISWTNNKQELLEHMQSLARSHGYTCEKEYFKKEDEEFKLDPAAAAALMGLLSTIFGQRKATDPVEDQIENSPSLKM